MISEESNDPRPLTWAETCYYGVLCVFAVVATFKFVPLVEWLRTLSN
jgi:hypothetical protein